MVFSVHSNSYLKCFILAFCLILIIFPQAGKTIITMHQGQPFCTYNRTLSRFERTPLHSRPLGCLSLCWQQRPYSTFLNLLSVRSCPPPLLSVWAGDLPAAVVAQDPASKLTPANCCWLFVGNNGRPGPSLRPRQTRRQQRGPVNQRPSGQPVQGE